MKELITSICEKKNQFICRDTGEEMILIRLENNVADFNQYLTLNELGSFIYKLVADGNNFEQIHAALLDAYDVSADQAAQDLSNFIEQLHQYTVSHA